MWLYIWLNICIWLWKVKIKHFTKAASNNNTVHCCLILAALLTSQDIEKIFLDGLSLWAHWLTIMCLIYGLFPTWRRTLCAAGRPSIWWKTLFDLPETFPSPSVVGRECYWLAHAILQENVLKDILKLGSVWCGGGPLSKVLCCWILKGWVRTPLKQGKG